MFHFCVHCDTAGRCYVTVYGMFQICLRWRTFKCKESGIVWIESTQIETYEELQKLSIDSESIIHSY